MEEAKYSANVRANLRGYDVQITARSDGEDDLLEILVAMVRELENIGATPERRWENGPSAGRSNGNGHKEPQAQAIPAPQPPPVPAPAPAPKPAPKSAAKPAQPKAQPKAPACQQCGSDAAVELIRWNDRETGDAKQAYKCQTCGVWIRN